MEQEEKGWDRNSHQGRRRDQVEYSEGVNYYVTLIAFISICVYYILEFFKALY